jgi:putative transposase
MARLNRLVLSGFAHHVTHRAVAGGRIVTDFEDRTAFLQALLRCSREHRVAVHAHVLLDDELQLLATPSADDGLGRMMQAFARLYVPGFNRRHERTGALWQGRFRAAPVGGAEPLLACMLYLEQAPVRAGVVASPLEFDGSSANAHAGRRLQTDPLLSPVPVESGYWKLGNTPFERELVYQRLLEQPLSGTALAAVENSTLKGWAYGSADFLHRLSQATDRRPNSLPKGRRSLSPIVQEFEPPT